MAKDGRLGKNKLEKKKWKTVGWDSVQILEDGG